MNGTSKLQFCVLYIYATSFNLIQNKWTEKNKRVVFGRVQYYNDSGFLIMIYEWYKNVCDLETCKKIKQKGN